MLFRIEICSIINETKRSTRNFWILNLNTRNVVSYSVVNFCGLTSTILQNRQRRPPAFYIICYRCFVFSSFVTCLKSEYVFNLICLNPLRICQPSVDTNVTKQKKNFHTFFVATEVGGEGEQRHVRIYADKLWNSKELRENYIIRSDYKNLNWDNLQIYTKIPFTVIPRQNNVAI